MAIAAGCKARFELGANAGGLVITSVLPSSDAASKLRRLHVDFAHEVFGGVIGLADAVGAEGIGFSDVGPGIEVGAVDGLRHFGLGQREDVVVALLVVAEPERPGIIRLGQLPVLNLGPERAVGEQDTLLGRRNESFSRAGHAAFSVAGAAGRTPSIWQIA